MADDVRQIALVRKGHTHIFRWRAGDEAALVAAIVGKAHRRELDWFDAAVVANQLRLQGDLHLDKLLTQAWIAAKG